MTSQADRATGRESSPLPPARIRIAHKMIGDVHVFTSPDVDNFQVADRDLETAFAAIPAEVCAVIADEYGQRSPYVLNMTYREYGQALYGVHRSPGATTLLFAVIARHAHIIDPNAQYVPPARLRRQALQYGARGSD